MWLRQTRMWERTLLVMSGDNGGPIYWIANPAYPHGGAANNCATPLPAPSLNSWPQLLASTSGLTQQSRFNRADQLKDCVLSFRIKEGRRSADQTCAVQIR